MVKPFLQGDLAELKYDTPPSNLGAIFRICFSILFEFSHDCLFCPQFQAWTF